MMHDGVLIPLIHFHTIDDDSPLQIQPQLLSNELSSMAQDLAGSIEHSHEHRLLSLRSHVLFHERRGQPIWELDFWQTQLGKSLIALPENGYSHETWVVIRAVPALCFVIGIGYLLFMGGFDPRSATMHAVWHSD